METRYGKRIVHLGEKSDTNLVRDVEKEQALKDLLERYLPSMEKDEEKWSGRLRALYYRKWR